MKRENIENGITIEETKAGRKCLNSEKDPTKPSNSEEEIGHFPTDCRRISLNQWHFN